MKTNIKLRVTSEQSAAVQKICFANNIGWGDKLELNFLDAPCLFIDHRWLSYSHNIKFYNGQDEEEVDADLFIRTKGSCVEDKKEIDLRNTWCYATVPNHDKLRLLGYDHEPIGACGDYYYINEHYEINDTIFTLSLQNYKQIELNENNEFVYVENTEYIESIEEFNENNEFNNFTKYGFEKPDFECEILKEYDDHLIGAVYQNEAYFGTSWTKEGTCLQTKGFGYINMNLTPLKKPWYETCKFPCLIWDKFAEELQIATHVINTTVYLISEIRELEEVQPLTDTEIEAFKQGF